MTARLPVSARLWAAAGLTVLPLGLVWARRQGSVTPGIIGPPVCNTDGYCDPGSYTPGVYVPGAVELGSDSPARLFLVAAATALIAAAVSVRTDRTLRIARLATGALAVAAVLALSQRALLPLTCLVLALAVVARPVWGARLPVFGRIALQR